MFVIFVLHGTKRHSRDSALFKGGDETAPSLGAADGCGMSLGPSPGGRLLLCAGPGLGARLCCHQLSCSLSFHLVHSFHLVEESGSKLSFSHHSFMLVTSSPVSYWILSAASHAQSSVHSNFPLLDPYFCFVTWKQFLFLLKARLRF